jgi:hypothetical protein
MGQTRLLIRTFFDRLFESDLMPGGLPQIQLVIWSMLLAATPTTGYAILMADKYAFEVFYRPLALEFAADRMILITLTMMAMGMVALFIWDGVFPDRRDVRILGPLPVPARRFVLARLGALGQVFALFATPLCLLQSITFPMITAGYGDPVGRFHGFAAHLATSVLVCLFVFTLLIAVQCVLLLAVGPRAAGHVSVAFQLLFAIGVIQLLSFLPALGRVLREGGQTHEGLQALKALPPTWFFGLYETFAGTAGPGVAALGRLALLATTASVLLSAGMYSAAYGVLSRRALDGPLPRARHPRRERLARLARRLPLPGFNSPVRAAIRQFSLHTLARSRYHRMVLAIYAGIALAIVVSSALSLGFRNGGAGLWRPGVSMMAMPLIFQFLMSIGLRVLLAVPTEPRARWVFRACEPADRNAAITGARDVMMLLVVVPSALFAFLQGMVFWSLPAAASHAVFCLVVGRLFADGLLAGVDKLPFACTYYPGKSRVFILWPLYIVAFFSYTLFLAEIDRALTTRPLGLLLFCGVAAIATAAVGYRRRQALASLTGLRFEEEDPDLMFQGFNLSEGMAAETKPPHGEREAHGRG